MAPLQQHMRDCEAFLGAPHEDVNRWMDEFFTTDGPKHRKHRHHWEGIREARQLFGEDGERAAIVHVLRDCRNIPSQEDYETGAADVLGLVSSWPASAYVHYTEEAFATLVKYKLEGPTGVVLWTFFKTEADLANFLTLVTRFPDDERARQLQNWTSAVTRVQEFGKSPIEISSTREPDGQIREWCDQITPIFSAILAQTPTSRFAMVPTDKLIMPLTLIDYEYVEELKATLTGVEPRDIARFALPEKFPVQVKAGQEVSGRAINLVSSQKSLMLGPMTVNQIPGVGMEIKFMILGAPQFILVSRVADRLYLKSGMHRAYLLASMGISEIPCVLCDEGQVPQVPGAYPTFAPQILALPRPPLLRDMLDSSMTLTVPLVRTSKVFRVSAEEFMVPTN
jgi:hypothetical protein